MLTPQQIDKLTYQYVTAWDNNDLDSMTEVLEAACKDKELARIIEEINLAFIEEKGIEIVEDDLALPRLKRFMQQVLDRLDN